MIDLMQSITQTHTPTWTDCCQLLLTLFNTEEWHQITQAALKWLKKKHTTAGTINAQAYAQSQFPEGKKKKKNAINMNKALEVLQ